MSQRSLRSDESKEENIHREEAGAGDVKIPSCPLYHSLSELQRRPGYYPNLNKIHIDAAKKTLKLIKEEGLNFNTDEEHEYLKVLRFLRARKFDVEQAMAMIRDDVKWRSENDRINLRYKTAYEVLQCDLALVYNYFPTWIQGRDKQDRPVSWRQFGKFEIWNILKLTTMERLIDFHAWESEQLLRLMHDRSKESGRNIETFTVIIDASGWNLGLANRDAYTFIKAMADTDSNHYPERLGLLIVINAPVMLSLAWRVIQGFLDDVQKSKIRIYGTSPEEWQPVLFSIINEDQVPQQFGGKMPDLHPDLALSSMDPPKRPRPPVPEDDETVVPKQVLCGVTVKKGKKGKKGKNGAAKEAAVNTSPSLTNSQRKSPLSLPSAVNDDNKSGSSSSAKKGWMGVLTCAPPRCNDGDDDFDFTVSAPSATPQGNAADSSNNEKSGKKSSKSKSGKKDTASVDGNTQNMNTLSTESAENFDQDYYPADEWDAESRVTMRTPAQGDRSVLPPPPPPPGNSSSTPQAAFAYPPMPTVPSPNMPQQPGGASQKKWSVDSSSQTAGGAVRSPTAGAPVPPAKPVQTKQGCCTIS